MSGFWAGSVPAWAYVVGVLLCNAALLVGMWIGWGRGFEAAKEDQHFEREQARARRVRPVYRERQEAIDRHSTYAHAAFSGAIDPPEVAHDWPEHVEQALAVVAEPDPRTDSQWTADHIADLHAFMAQLLSQHPAVEEL